MHFPTLAALIISTLSATVASQEVPAVRICKNANYEDCLDIKTTGAYCEDLYGPWNDSISSIKILSPALGICGFHKDRDCEGPYFTIDYRTPVDDVWRYSGFNDQISSFLCTGIVE